MKRNFLRNFLICFSGWLLFGIVAFIGCTPIDSDVKPDTPPEGSAFDNKPITDLSTAVAAHVDVARSDLAKQPPDVEDAQKHLAAAAAGVPAVTDGERAIARDAVKTIESLKQRMNSLAALLIQARDTINTETQKRLNAENQLSIIKRLRANESAIRLAESKDRAHEVSQDRSHTRAGWAALGFVAVGAALGWFFNSWRTLMYFGFVAFATRLSVWAQDSLLESKAWNWFLNGAMGLCFVVLIGVAVAAWIHRKALYKLLQGATLTATENKIVATLGGAPAPVPAPNA